MMTPKIMDTKMTTALLVLKSHMKSLKLSTL